MRRAGRAHALTVRGHLVLASAAAMMLFLAPSAVAAGRWLALHTWLAAGIAAAAGTALACYTLADRARPRGESPQVSHPRTGPSHTPVEVRK